MKDKKISLRRKYFIGLMVISIIMCICIWWSGGLVNKNRVDHIREYNDGWEKIVSVQQVEDINGTRYCNVFEKTLEYDTSNSCYMGFITFHQFVRVYADNEEIYQFGYDLDNFIMKSPGNVYNLVNLSGMKKGSVIRIELESPYEKYKDFEIDTYIGEERDFYYTVIINSLSAIMVCVVLLFVGIVFVLIWLLLSKKFELNDGLAYLGIFSIFIAIWSIHETEIMYLIPTNKQIGTYLSFISLAYMVVPIVFFIKETYGRKYEKQLTKVCQFSFFIALLVSCIQFFQIADFVEIAVLIHIMMGVALVFLFRVCAVELYLNLKKHQLNLFCTLMIILLIAVIIDILRYSILESTDSAMFTRLALLIYIVGLGVTNIKETVHIIEVGFNAGKYEKMAYTDALTGAKTRAAFVEKTTKMANNRTDYANVGILNFDINCLKILNDRYGHDTGDRYIKESANIIMQAFANCGKCYRVGGDEFIVIFEKFKDNEYQHSVKKMQKLIDEFNEKKEPHEHELGISLGYAVGTKMDVTLDTVMKRADENMYKNKKITKQLRNSEI